MTPNPARCTAPGCPALGTYRDRKTGVRLCVRHGGRSTSSMGKPRAIHDPKGLDPADVRAFLDAPSTPRPEPTPMAKKTKPEPKPAPKPKADRPKGKPPGKGAKVPAGGGR